MPKILDIQNLSKWFGSQIAVNNISFSIEKGHVYGILGPNGSGKSTTLGMVLNVVNPTSGSFKLFEGSINTHQALKKVGAIIERPNFYPYMTAEQNLKLVCQIKDTSFARIDKVLEIVGLEERKYSKFRTYSLGMKQRLAIASALLNEPEILILDEPTNGLDPQGIHQIRKIIQSIAKQGTTILLASHLLDEVEKVCSHVVVLRKGTMLYAGPVDEMIASHGFFELKSDDDVKLKAYLESHPSFGPISLNENSMKVILNAPMEAADLNKILFEQGITLTHLVKRKESLEEQFLVLTDQITKL